jgi:hypothetical protein
VECILCGKIVHAVVRRLKQHLVGGYGEVSKWLNTTTANNKEIHEYLKEGAEGGGQKMDRRWRPPGDSQGREKGQGTRRHARERCVHCTVGWFCCSAGTRVSSNMGFEYYWADIGKHVGRLMHASQPKSGDLLRKSSRSS